MELREKVKGDMKSGFNAFIDSHQTTTIQTPFDMQMEDAVIESMFYPGRNPGAPKIASYTRIERLKGLNTLEITYAFVIPLVGELSVAIEAILTNNGVDAVVLPATISQMHEDPPTLIDYGWNFDNTNDVYYITKDDLTRKKATRNKTRDTLHLAMNRTGRLPPELSNKVGTFLSRKGDRKGGTKRKKSRRRLRK